MRPKLRAPVALSIIIGTTLSTFCFGASIFTKPPELFTFNTLSKEKTKPKLLPFRVYQVYLQEDPNPRFALTDEMGNFANPFRILRKNSVLPGNYLGQNESLKFALLPDGTWKKSTWPLTTITELFDKPKRLQFIYWDTNPQQIRRKFSSNTKILEKPIVKLCAVQTNDCSTVAKPPYLPERLYYVSFEQGKWDYMVTGRYGEFSFPVEVLNDDSVIPGKWIGDSFSYSRYQIQSGGRWTSRADIYERQVYSVLDRPIKAKYVNYDLNLGKR